MEKQKMEIPEELLEEASGGANHSPADAELSSSGQVSSLLKNESNPPPDLPEPGSTIPPIDIRMNILAGKAYENPWNMSTIEEEMSRIGLPNT